MDHLHPFTNNIEMLNKKSLSVQLKLNNKNYSIGENIGCGAYGVVCSAIDLRNGERVAIKKIPRIFDNLILAKRTYREIKILQHFKHDNVIHIRELLTTSRGVSNFCDVCIVFDLMQTDLHQLIRSKQELTVEHIRYFLYQILRGLKYIHSANVLHRDLKPSNLLINENCDLKIGDFGMARPTTSCEEDNRQLMTHYVATRWYRSPELMLFRQQYTTAVDVWSVGCIFAELLGRKPIFPGKNLLDQIMLIIGVLGSPTDEFIAMAHTERIKDFLRKLEKKTSVPLVQLYPTAGPKALRLLEKLLTFDPRQRISVDDALNDLYLNKYHDSADEPTCRTFGFEFEKQDLDEMQLRLLIYKELQHDNTDSAPSPSDSTSALAHISSFGVETMDTVSPSVVLNNVQLQDVAMTSAKNSSELFSSDATQVATPPMVVSPPMFMMPPMVVTPPTVMSIPTVVEDLISSNQLPAEVGADCSCSACGNKTKRTSSFQIDAKSNTDRSLIDVKSNADCRCSATKAVEFGLVLNNRKSCNNVDFSVGGITVARMQSWKILPCPAAQSGKSPGKDKPRRRVNVRRKNYAPVSSLATDRGSPVNVKEALRAVLLSETRDFRTKAAKLKAKSRMVDSSLSKKNLPDPKKLTNGSILSLTDEDKGLLSRWMKMQKGGDTSHSVGSTEFNDAADFFAATLHPNYVPIYPKIGSSQILEKKITPKKKKVPTATLR